MRARLIRNSAHATHGGRVVLFTCGNAAQALRSVTGLDVLAIGDGMSLQPGRWWKPEEIARVWPDRFDATSGHLSLPLMARLAKALRGQLGDLPRLTWALPTGSGETLVAMRWAYPDHSFVPLVHTGPQTTPHPQMPLHEIVHQRDVIDGRTATFEERPWQDQPS